MSREQGKKPGAVHQLITAMHLNLTANCKPDHPSPYLRDFARTTKTAMRITITKNTTTPAPPATMPNPSLSDGALAAEREGAVDSGVFVPAAFAISVIRKVVC